MATSNNDRVSSRRLLDTLKGLQASRHLGSEPEVVTETVEYPAVVSPAVGVYQNSQELANALGTPEESRLPFKVYTNSQFNGTSYPLTITEPSGEYVELTQHKTIDSGGLSAELYLENSYDGGSIHGYTGYALYNQGVWSCIHITNGDLEQGIGYVWEMSAKTETTTTKTKRTIKQDYVPNADWTQNDPDGDGYVKGRTHWVELGETEATVTVMKSASGEGISDKFGAVKKFAYPTGEYDPGRVGDIISITDTGLTIQVSYIGEDSDGNAIIPTNLNEVQNAVSTTSIGIMLFKQGDNIGAYIMYPNVADNDICTATIVSENVHKLDRKFYDYVDKDKVVEEVTDKLPELVVGSAFLPMKYLERVLKDNPELVRIRNEFVDSVYRNGGQLEFNIYAVNRTLDDITYNTKFVVVFKGNRYGAYSTYVGNCVLAYNCLMPPEMDQHLDYNRQSNTYIENVVGTYASDREILINQINNKWCVFDANCEDSITNPQASVLASVIFRVRQINYGNGTGRDELYITKQDNSKKLLYKGSGYVGDITCTRYGTQSTGSKYGCEFVDLEDTRGNCVARLLLLEDVRLPNANAEIALNNRHLDKPFSRKFYWYNDTQYGEGTLTCGTNAELSFDNASATDNVNIVPILIPIM